MRQRTVREEVHGVALALDHQGHLAGADDAQADHFRQAGHAIPLRDGVCQLPLGRLDQAASFCLCEGQLPRPPTDLPPRRRVCTHTFTRC